MAIKALKYMLLSKVQGTHDEKTQPSLLECEKSITTHQVMLNLPDEVTNLVSGKLALRYFSLSFMEQWR